MVEIKMHRLLIFLTILGVANSQLIGSGGCATNVTPIAPFDANRFLGKWYEISKYVNAEQWGDKCITATLSNNSGSYSLYMWKQNSSSQDGFLSLDISFPNISEGMFQIVLPGAYKGAKTNFYILDTDYSFWALVYSCSDFFGFTKTEYAWFASRLRISVSNVDLPAIASKHGVQLNGLLMIPTDQFWCPWIY